MAAVIFLVVRSPSTGTTTSFICSKTKVAPLKKLTIPRLELTAALLLAKLTNHVVNSLKFNVASTHLWTDSQVTLMWIKSHASRWKDYVRNRVAQIQDLSTNITWRHVPGVMNPADCGSRGISTEQLVNHQLWWTGPQWMTQPLHAWPAQPDVASTLASVEARPGISLLASAPTPVYHWDLIDRYSTAKRLFRITALVTRFVLKLTGELSTPPACMIPAEDYKQAQLFWVKATQAAFFAHELTILNRGSKFSSTHAFSKLTAFLDEEGVIRVGGRLQESTLNYQGKHPAILPRTSRLTSLIIADAHLSTLHGGTQLTLAKIRQTCWIIGGRAPVKSHILRCVICARQRGLRAQQLMAQLPIPRLTPSRAFLHTGVDYAGPIQVKTWKGRGSKTHKGWICVFVCFSTSATHLETVTDCSTEGFLAAYRRFAARRGIAHTIYSDCGTNFIGASAELKRLFISCTSEHHHLSSILAADGTAWKFNPPASPHMGGKWEAAVKSIKFHLRRTIGELLLTYEEFSTLLAQIESVLNSRPLEPLSDDPEDVSALTPGHFLIGSALNTVPEPSLLDSSAARLSKWQLIQQRVQLFWTQWSAHYLQRHQLISKWHHPSHVITVGSLVFITDERMPPSKWPLARVLDLLPGKDGLTRVVKLKTATTTLTRPIAKLSPLPI